jgi:glycosyltransferase involved in cell wall biosynthesis
MAETISVVIPTYNRKNLLDRLLQSLEDQSLPKEHFNVFVVDDGSSDGTCDMLKEKGIAFESSPHRGPARARNLGVEKTGAPLIAFIDDDCVADRAWLKSVIEAYTKGDLKGAAEGDVISTGEQVPLSHSVSHRGAGGFMTCNLVITRALFKKVGGFNERFKYPMNEDFEFFLRLVKHGNPLYVSGMVVYHPVRKLSYIRTLLDSFHYAVRRISSEYLLMELCPDDFGKVKFEDNAKASIRRLSYRYFISNVFKHPLQLVHHPVRAMMWMEVCMARQISFLILRLAGYRG